MKQERDAEKKAKETREFQNEMAAEAAKAAISTVSSIFGSGTSSGSPSANDVNKSPEPNNTSFDFLRKIGRRLMKRGSDASSVDREAHSPHSKHKKKSGKHSSALGKFEKIYNKKKSSKKRRKHKHRSSSSASSTSDTSSSDSKPAKHQKRQKRNKLPRDVVQCPADASDDDKLTKKQIKTYRDIAGQLGVTDLFDDTDTHEKKCEVIAGAASSLADIEKTLQSKWGENSRH